MLKSSTSEVYSHKHMKIKIYSYDEERLGERLMKGIKILLKKKKNENLVMNDREIFLKKRKKKRQ